MTEMQDWYASGRDRTRGPVREEPVAPPFWIAHAFRLAYNVKDSLAGRMTRIPETHRGPRAGDVKCACGEDVLCPDRVFSKCPGDCGRYFMRDGEVVWAARLPEQEA